MKKKISVMLLAMLAALCLCFGLAACGGNGGTGGQEIEQGGSQGGQEGPGGSQGSQEGPGGSQGGSQGSQEGPGGSQGEEGGDPPAHVHTYTVENVCSGCGEKWEFTEGLEYQLDAETDTYTVTGIGTALDTVKTLALVIPYGYQGKSVTSIADEAFHDCSGLTDIQIPDSVTSIADEAFYNCSGLKSVTIGSGVTSIGASAFSGTAYYNDDSNWENETVLYIGDYLIGARKSISGNYSIRDNTKVIADRAFYYCSELTGIEIPDSVTSIGNSAFWGCSGLTSIEIPDSVTTIGEDAFWGCSGLTSIEIPDSVTTIGEDAFWGCSGLTSIEIPDSVTTIGEGAFYNCSGLKSVTIGSGVTSIGYQAFYECGKLTRVNITDLSAWCKIDFADDPCSNPLAYAHHLYLNDVEIKKLEIPADIKEIKPAAFYNCRGLTSVTIGSDVTSIGSGAFKDCSGLTSVTIGSGVTSIKGGAFSSCPKLIEVWNYSKLPLEPGTHEYGGVAEFAKHVYTGQEKGFQTVTSEGFIFYEEGKDCYLLGYNGDETQLVLPEKNPNGSDYEIYELMFYDCSELESVTIRNGVTSIGSGAFWGCSGLTSITILDSVTSIGEWAFYECGRLESVTIGSGVTSIGNFAFLRCFGLKNVYYKGTAETWNNILIGDLNNKLTNATRYYFSEEEPDEAKWQESENWWHYDDETGEIVIWKKENA